MKFWVSNHKEIGFLFGSGISVACYPLLTTDVLTNKILSRTVIANMDEKYVSTSIEFLRRIKVEIDQYYSDRSNRLTNYEDLYYITSQNTSSETFNFDNPIVTSFIEKISKDIKPLLESLNFNKIEQLTKVVRRCIRNNIWVNLRDSQFDKTKLKLIVDSITDKEFDKFILFTLNHDLILEDLLKQNDIIYENGFSNTEGDDGYFNINRFSTTQKRICYAKLHGSINWQRYSHNKIEMFPPKKYNSDYEDYPVFLIGTFNKMFDYTNNDIYFQLYHFFYKKLKIINTLIISGYSFGDKGINTRLHRWMELVTENQMIIIDPNCDRLKNSARGIISLNWDGWVERKKLLPISKGIDSIKWDEVKSLVN